MKRLLLVMALFSLLFASKVYAGGVTDDNNGNKGYILVSTGENHGANSVGHWTDSSFLKGERGETGATGSQGEQGIAGNDGLNGSNGLDGQNGKSIEYNWQGTELGIKQEGQEQYEYVNLKGESGQAGQDGQAGTNGQDGAVGETGKTGDKGATGSQGLQGIQGKGLEDRVELIGEVRLLDTKRTTWSVYAGHDVNNDVNIVGAKVTVKIGRSYEERRLDELEARLNLIQPTVSNNVEVIPTTTGFKIKTNY